MNLAPYWQVVNSVAKYRENNDGGGLILLHTNMSGVIEVV